MSYGVPHHVEADTPKNYHKRMPSYKFNSSSYLCTNHQSFLKGSEDSCFRVNQDYLLSQHYYDHFVDLNTSWLSNFNICSERCEILCKLLLLSYQSTVKQSFHVSVFSIVVTKMK